MRLIGVARSDAVEPTDEAYYELVELLGEGGMGRVYRGVHWPSGIDVAVKTLRADVRDDPVRKRLLLDEATAAAQVRDAHIVQLYDVGRDADGNPFLVMELVRGFDLERWLEVWPGAATILGALCDVLEGLAAAHAAGIVHRDLKPPNLLVDAVTGGVKIADFGIATVVDPLRDGGEVRIAGTPELMAPEQLLGIGEIGPWTDLYAIGVILHHVLFGRSPFANELELLPLLHAKLSFQRPATLAAREGLTVPPALADLAYSLLVPEPRARPRFAAAVRAQLLAAIPTVVDAIPRRLRPVTPPASTTEPTVVDRSIDETVLGAPGREQPAVPPPTLVPTGPEIVGTGETRLPARLRAAGGPRPGASLARLRDLALVGREEERRELLSLIDETRTRGGARLVVYGGEAGIGKSRLARWGLAEVERRGLMESAACAYDPTGAGTTSGLRHALRRLFGAPSAEADPRTTLAWLPDDGGRLDRTRLVRLLARGKTAASANAALVAALAHDALVALSRVRPVYLWLDDLAWARDGGIDLVEALLAAQDAAVLVVATARTGTTRQRDVRERFARLLTSPSARERELAPLGFRERTELVAQIVPFAPGVADGIAGAVEGSPLVCVQLVHDWLERGLLAPTPLGVAPHDGVQVDDLLRERPVAALLAGRAEALLASFDERAPFAEGVLLRAALLGVRFEDGALRAALAGDAKLAGVADEVLDRALLHGVLRAEVDRAYRFDHNVLRDAIAMRLGARKDRVRILVDAANGLLARYGRERPDVSGRVAELLHDAGVRELAWERLSHAIEVSAWIGDIPLAERHLATARSWADRDGAAPVSPERLRVAMAEARVAYFALRYPEARIAIERARGLAQLLGDVPSELTCDAVEADVLFYQDLFEDSLRVAMRCWDRGTLDDPDIALAAAHAAHRLADLCVLQGNLDHTLQWRERALAYTEASSRPFRARIEKANLAETHLVRGDADTARRLLAEMIRDANAAQDDAVVDAAYELDVRAVVALELGFAQGTTRPGDAAAAHDWLRERERRLEARDDPWRLTSSRLATALVALAERSPELPAAVDRFVRAFAAVPHEEAFTLFGARHLVQALDERGEFALARRIDALLDARVAAWRAGFGERDTLP